MIGLGAWGGLCVCRVELLVAWAGGEARKAKMLVCAKRFAFQLTELVLV